MDKHAWHQRYRQQAGWTAGLRAHLFRQVNLEQAGRVLEVGCGTGAVLAGLSEFPQVTDYGIDLDLTGLRLARENAPGAALAGADALRLPFADNSFDVTLCHFLLLWVADPAGAVAEMARVTRPGGHVLALAEPDYGGRVDHPPEMAALGRWQAEALRDQGADPEMGRKLAGLLAGARLREVRGGVLGGEWSGPPDREAWEAEWDVLANDLRGRVEEGELTRLHALDADAWRDGRRVLFVPTFYAWGRV